MKVSKPMKRAAAPLSSVQSLAVGLFVSIVGLLVAFVPSMAGYEHVVIAGGTQMIVAAFLLANSVHAHAVAHVAAAHPVVPPAPPAPVKPVAVQTPPAP